MPMQELEEAERAFIDVCDQIAKAERFFPVPGSSPGNGTSTPPRGAPSREVTSQSWQQYGCCREAGLYKQAGVPPES